MLHLPKKVVSPTKSVLPCYVKVFSLKITFQNSLKNMEDFGCRRSKKPLQSCVRVVSQMNTTPNQTVIVHLISRERTYRSQKTFRSSKLPTGWWRHRQTINLSNCFDWVSISLSPSWLRISDPAVAEAHLNTQYFDKKTHPVKNP